LINNLVAHSRSVSKGLQVVKNLFPNGEHEWDFHFGNPTGALYNDDSLSNFSQLAENEIYTCTAL